MLNPNLDLWITTKPILEKWMKQQMGWRGLINNIKAELPYWSYTLPMLPRNLANGLIKSNEVKQQSLNMQNLLNSYKRQNQAFMLIIIVLLATIFWLNL